MSYEELYEKNEDFKRYVDKCCVTYHLTKDEALKHNLIHSVGDYYKEKTEVKEDV